MNGTCSQGGGPLGGGRGRTGVKIDCARRCGTCPECLCRKKDEIRRIGSEREEKTMSTIKDFPCHLFVKARFVFFLE